MSRVAQNQLLCVFSRPAMRSQMLSHLRRSHPHATLSELGSGWLVVEAPLGPPQSPLVGGRQSLRFALGEERVLDSAASPFAPVSPSTLDELAEHLAAEPARLAELPGDFCFVILSANGRALAVRSCSGVPALYGFYRDGVTAVGTRLDWLAQVFPDELQFSLSAIASAATLGGIAPGHGSLLRGITSVPVGHSAQFGRWSSPRVRRYWDPRDAGVTMLGVPELAEKVGVLLRAELRRHLWPGQSNVLLFSGGLDSALLAGASVPLVERMDAVTILPRRDHPAHARERHFASALSHLFQHHVACEFDYACFATRLSQLPPTLCPLGGIWLALEDLDEPPVTITSGWFADEAWGVLRLSDWLERVDYEELPRLVAHAPFRRQIPRWLLNRWRSGRFGYPPASAGYPALLNQDEAPMYQSWLATQLWTAAPRTGADRLVLNRRLTDLGGPYAENAAARGARALIPFASRELVELAASVDPRLLFHRGHSKQPLREAARWLLPLTYSTRTDKGGWAPAPEPLPAFEVPPTVVSLLDKHRRTSHLELDLDEQCLLRWLSLLESGRIKVKNERPTTWQ